MSCSLLQVSSLSGCDVQCNLTVLNLFKSLKYTTLAKKQLSQVAHLSKLDLVTQMVTEFPSLQGLMGGLYAHQEEAVVSEAISEQYLPLYYGGELPKELPKKGECWSAIEAVPFAAAQQWGGMGDTLMTTEKASLAFSILKESCLEVRVRLAVYGRGLV